MSTFEVKSAAGITAIIETARPVVFEVQGSLRGKSGDTGVQGIQGVKGDTGTTGSTGSKGDTGVKGDTGAKGDSGSVFVADEPPPGPVTGELWFDTDDNFIGDPMLKGDTGTAGSAGAKGDTGTAGSAGSKGDTGTTGASGAAGAKGDTGASGGSNIFYNVKDAPYSAVGDGSNDDTAEIQAAIDAASTAGGGIVFFPKGTYKISAAITLKDKVSLLGAGTSNSTSAATIKQVTANTHGLLLTNTTASFGNLRVENLRIEGTGAGTGKGIYLKNTGSGGVFPPFLYMSFRDLYIASFGAEGFQCESLIVSKIDRVVIESCGAGFYFKGNGSGADYSTVNTSLTVTNCYANGIPSGIGYRTTYSTYIAFIACAADDCSIAYLTDVCQAINYTGCGAEWGVGTSATPGDGFKVSGGSSAIGFINCYNYQSIGKAYWVTGGSTGITFIGCAENSPVSGVASLQLDANCTATISDCSFNTAQVIASTASLVTLNNGSGQMTVGQLIVQSEINGVIVTSAATGFAPSIAPGGTGSDTDLPLYLAGKGTGGVTLADGNILEILQALGVAGAVNFLAISNAATGDPVEIDAAGADTNVDLLLIPKGNGAVRYGGATVDREFALTDGATVNIDASEGNYFYLETSGDRTIAAPTNAKEGQKARIGIKAVGGIRTPTFAGGAGGFRAGALVVGTIASGTTKYFDIQYHSTDVKWDIVNIVGGY